MNYAGKKPRNKTSSVSVGDDDGVNNVDELKTKWVERFSRTFSRTDADV